MQANQDYKKLLTEVIKKQIVILGPDITLAKARNVAGLVIADDGTVTDISGSPQEITQQLVNQFVQLSGEIVKKTMEPLLSMNNQTAPNAATPVITPPVPTIPVVPPTPTPSAPVIPSQSVDTSKSV